MRQESVELRDKLITQAIQDPLFKRELAFAATEIVQSCRNAPNEATVESIFERILYSVLRNIGLNFHPEKEIPISIRRHTAKGRTDSRIGTLIIEYKQPAKLKTDVDIKNAVSQLSDYISAEFLEVGNEVVGFLTDGTKILELRKSDNSDITQSGFSEIDSESLNRLVRAIISLEKSALNAQNLIKDFCGTAQDGIIFEVARKLNYILAYKATIKTEMLRTEWEALFRLAHEDQSLQRKIQDRRKILSEIFNININEATMEYRALFSLHTAYAIILKFIAFRVVSDVKFGAPIQNYKSLTKATPDVLRAFVSTLEDGELFRHIGILNLLEGDFFSWYSDANQWDDIISESIRDIMNTLSRYEDTRNIFERDKVVDLFRLLYEATVPQVVRSSLGEFYTPYWLASHVLDSSRPTGEWSALDPCCGSGTFLIAAIAKIRTEMQGQNPKVIAEAIINRVCGIDLNPLAVLTSRIHFFIHIADLISEFQSEIAIPVYLGDASNIPTVKVQNEVEFLHYELKTLKTPLEIDIPVYMTEDLLNFAKIMFEFERYIKSGDYEEAKKYLLSEANINCHPIIVRERLGALADQIIDLEKRQWNGIWARVIANFISTSKIGLFTNIIGNPPWIDWKSLPSGYREKVKALCVDKGLFSGAGRTGGINLNVCALIAHVAATNWLAKGGRMSFLMPSELVNQASYEGWRQSVGGANCSFEEFHDWSSAGHPFDPVKEDFMTYVMVAEPRNQSAVPVYKYQKNERLQKAHLWESKEEASKYLQVTNHVAGQIVKGSTGYTFAPDLVSLEKFRKIAGENSYKGREGIEFYPQELVLFEFDSLGPKTGTVWVTNIQVQKSKYKIPKSRILLETEYLFPLVKGPKIGKLSYDDPEILVVFPYEEGNPYSPVSKSVLKKKSPLLLQYFEKYKEIIEKQTHYSDSLRADGEFYGLARTGPYSFKECYVAYRDNTKWNATVITKKVMPWGETKRYLFQNHAVSICERIDGGNITEAEAFYIAGIFNTDIVCRFIYSSSDSRSFKIRAPIYTPTFDEANSSHVKISELARDAMNDPIKFSNNLSKIEALFLDLCESR